MGCHATGPAWVPTFNSDSAPTRANLPSTADRRTPNAERRTPNAERRTPNAERIDSCEMPDVAIGLDTFGDVTAAPDGTLNSAAHVLRDVVDEACSPTRSGSMPLASGSITAATLRSRHQRSSWARLPAEPRASFSDRRSPSSAPTTRYACFNASRQSTGSQRAVRKSSSAADRSPNGTALFGYDMSRYEELFEDKLRLFAELLKPGPVTWRGTTRAAIATGSTDD